MLDRPQASLKRCRAPSYVGVKNPALSGRAITRRRFANQMGKLKQGSDRS